LTRTSSGLAESVDDNTSEVDENTGALEDLAEKTGSLTVGIGNLEDAFIRGLNPEQRAQGISGIKLDPSDGLQIRSPNSPVPIGAFDNGGRVPQDGIFRLQQGEQVITASQARVTRRGPGFTGFDDGNAQRGLDARRRLLGMAITQRGATEVLSASEGSPVSQNFAPQSGPSGNASNPALNHMLAVMAARGRINDQLGPTAQRQIAKAVTPVNAKGVRRRDITRDITRNTALTQTGQSTTK
jgi:hypothetical protein